MSSTSWSRMPQKPLWGPPEGVWQTAAVAQKVQTLQWRSEASLRGPRLTPLAPVALISIAWVIKNKEEKMLKKARRRWEQLIMMIKYNYKWLNAASWDLMSTMGDRTWITELPASHCGVCWVNFSVSRAAGSRDALTILMLTLEIIIILKNFTFRIVFFVFVFFLLSDNLQETSDELWLEGPPPGSFARSPNRL